MANPHPKGHPNPQNLINISKEQRIENGRKGGLKSQEVQKEKRAFRDAVNLIASLPCMDAEISEILEKVGIKADNKNGIALAMALKAMQGDKQAADWVRDTAGEKPSNDIDVKGGSMVIAIKGENDL